MLFLSGCWHSSLILSAMTSPWMKSSNAKCAHTLTHTHTHTKDTKTHADVGLTNQSRPGAKMSSALTSHSVSFLFSCVICTELYPTEKSRPAQFFMDMVCPNHTAHTQMHTHAQRRKWKAVYKWSNGWVAVWPRLNIYCCSEWKAETCRHLGSYHLLV